MTSGTPWPPTDLMARSTSFNPKVWVVTFSSGKRLKRNFQLMSGAAWLELLCRHIPDRYQQLVRQVGWYSNRARGERAKNGARWFAT
jgi:hypothetical protein